MTIRRGFASKIENVEYFYDAETDAAKAAALGLGVGELDANGERRDYVQYLGGGDNDAGAGTFLVLERQRHPAKSDPQIASRRPSPFRSVATGQRAFGSVCRDLVAGVDPATGDVVLGGRRYKGAKHNPGGFDLQIGAVKSVSLAAVFDVDRSAGIRAAEREGYDDAMRWAFDTGLMATRVTKQGSTVHEPARKVVMAIYTHATSRSEDPHDHHHGALFAMCERQDGSLGTLSNFLLKKYGGAINAYKRCAEAGALKKLGLAVERDPENRRSYRLAGVDQRLVELFSKRRAMIEKAAKKAGIDTAKERLAAQLIAYDTRDDKRFADAHALEVRWESELRAAGYTRESFAFLLEKAARDQDAARPIETPEEREARLRSLVTDALSDLQRETAVFTRATLYQTAFEALQTEVEDGAEAARLVDALERSGELVLLAERGGEPVYTTSAMIDAEKTILRTAWEGRGKGPAIDPECIDAVLAAANAALKAKHGLAAGITSEQERAVRHALSGDQFTLTQGYAGTGKSFVTNLHREVVERQGYRVFGTAPSWKATDVLRRDCGLQRESCAVLAKLLHAYRQGELKFDAKSYIILDEAGMVSTRDMAELFTIAKQTGASLRLQGDMGQFRAVDAGQPFAALQRLLGAAELRDVRRQHEDWQRAASITLDDANNSGNDADAAAKIKQALQAYDDKGRIIWADDDEAAMKAAVDKVMQWRREHPTDSTAIVTEWNANARAVSAMLRARLKGAGQIAQDDHEMSVIVRGSKDNAKSVRMAFAVGDEIIFGENVPLRGRIVRNNDLARIISLNAADATNPRFKFRFEDGQQIEATYAELVGRREDGEVAAPRMQHSLAITGHSSQGATYARTVDLTLEGHGREATLVATTRHRIDHFKAVAIDRLADKIESKKATTLSIDRGGRIAKAAEQDDEAADAAELDEVKKEYFAECAGHEAFGNVSDFFADPYTFAGIEKPIPSRRQGAPVPMAPLLRRARMAALAVKTPRRAPRSAVPDRPKAATVAGPASPHARRRLLGWWENLKGIGDSTSRWLVEARGISSRIFAKFPANIRAEPIGETAANRFGVAFAHRDADLRLTSIVRRGPNGFNRDVSGGHRGLFQAGELAAPSRAYITKSSIDTLSMYQCDGQPEPSALLASDGSFHTEAREILVRRAREWPDTEWHIGQDTQPSNADRATDPIFVRRCRQCDEVIAAILDGNPGATIVIRDPGPEFEDWNNHLRGPDFSKPAVAARAERAARDKKARAEALMRIEEERHHREEAANRPKIR